MNSMRLQDSGRNPNKLPVPGSTLVIRLGNPSERAQIEEEDAEFTSYEERAPSTELGHLFGYSLVNYTDPGAMLLSIGEICDVPCHSESEREHLMRTVALGMESALGVTVPSHSEEAFILALFRSGIISHAVLN